MSIVIASYYDARPGPHLGLILHWNHGYFGAHLVLDKTAPGEESQQVQLFEPGNIPWKKLAFQSTIDALRDYKESL